MTDQTTDTTAEANETGTPVASEAEQNANSAEQLLGEESKESEEVKTEDAKGSEGADDKKAADDKGDKDGADKSEDAKGDEDEADGAPDEYEPFTLPEGMEADAQGMEEFGALAKELDLSQENAQKLIDLQAALVQRASDDAWQVWADTQNEWAKEVRADKEFGGTNIDASKAAAKAFVLKYGGKEALQALQMTGAGNHPHVFKALARAGKELAEDEILSGASGGDADVPLANRMFPEQS